MLYWWLGVNKHTKDEFKPEKAIVLGIVNRETGRRSKIFPIKCGKLQEFITANNRLSIHDMSSDCEIFCYPADIRMHGHLAIHTKTLSRGILII